MLSDSFTKSGVAEFIAELEDDWEKDRAEKVERWQTSLDFFEADFTSDTWKDGEGEDWRSDYVSMLVKTKTMAGVSIVTDMVLQGNRLPFDLEDLELKMINADPQMVKMRELQIAAMKNRIHQQLEWCHADREIMKCGMSLGLYGETYLKSPILLPITKSGFKKVSYADQFKVQDPNNQFIRYEQETASLDSPGIAYVSVWSILRDMEYENIQEGLGIIQREMISPYELRRRAKDPFFSKEVIDSIISRTAGTSAGTGSIPNGELPPGQRDITSPKRTIKYSEFWGRVPVKKLRELAGSYGKETINGMYDIDVDEMVDDSNGYEVEVKAVTADDELVMIAPNYETRPYHWSVWEPVLDKAEGRGIADNLKHDQKMVNGVLRAIIDNTKLAGNVLLAIKEELLAAGENAEIHPGKLFALAEECDDARQAIQQVIVQDVSAGLLQLYGLMQKQSDEDTNLPKLISGETVDQSAETAFEIGQRMESAGKYLGGVIRRFDEGIIEPAISAIYTYNMKQPGISDDRGNYSVRATGYSSFYNKVIRAGQLEKRLGLAVTNPIIGAEVRVRAHLEELYKNDDLDPDKFLKTDAEKQQEQQGQQQIQMQQIQLEMQRIMAEIKEMGAQVQKTMADAQLALAKAETEKTEQAKNMADARAATINAVAGAIQPNVSTQ